MPWGGTGVKRALAVTVCNHYKRINFTESQLKTMMWIAKIETILMIGQLVQEDFLGSDLGS